MYIAANGQGGRGCRRAGVGKAGYLVTARQGPRGGPGAVPADANLVDVDLLRHDVLLKGAAPGDRDIAAIVDECAVALFVALGQG